MKKPRRRAYVSLSDYMAAWGDEGKTQAQFAALHGISVGYLSDLKNRKVQPSLTLAKKLADECHIPIEAFIVEGISS